VIATMAIDELHEKLSKSNFVTITIDASNRKEEVKTAPCFVRYFAPEQGVKVKLLDFQSVPGETKEILTNYLLSVVKKHDFSKKRCRVLW
jgi:hypothetical protein